MTDEEKKFIIKVNVDKAKNKVTATIIMMIISISTYILPLLLGDFDFGIIFEAIAIIFLFIARIFMSKYDEINSKRLVICSMLSIGWILVYDIIWIISTSQYIVDIMLFIGDIFLGEIFLIISLSILFSANKDLAKADNPTKYKETTDWFYEKYEKKD